MCNMYITEIGIFKLTEHFSVPFYENGSARRANRMTLIPRAIPTLISRVFARARFYFPARAESRVYNNDANKRAARERPRPVLRSLPSTVTFSSVKRPEANADVSQRARYQANKKLLARGEYAKNDDHHVKKIASRSRTQYGEEEARRRQKLFKSAIFTHPATAGR